MFIIELLSASVFGVKSCLTGSGTVVGESFDEQCIRVHCVYRASNSVSEVSECSQIGSIEVAGGAAAL